MRVPFWLKAVLLIIPGILLVFFFVLIAIGWWVQGHRGSSGGELRPLQAAYDVRHYALDVAVDPANKSIVGGNRITVEVIEPIDRFEVHLDDRLDVHGVSVDGSAAGFDHEDGLITVELSDAWAVGGRHIVDISYGGQPKRAIRAPWIDGFVWSETPSGEPWIGVTSEGDGADGWWPCKDHPSDEPDEGMTIALTVPEGVVGLANGRPQGERVNGDGTVTSSWEVGFPINNYAVSINIGPYTPVEAIYHGVDGTLDETIVFWAIPEFVDAARTTWRQTPGVLEFFGRRFGEYPFFADKLWVAHAPFLGMEHQTLIAYGADFTDNDYGFDELLVHELAHEWWGNKLTASDWSDLWIHEGFASYAEALLVLDTLGEEDYLNYMQWLRHRMSNDVPLVPGRDLTSVEAFSPDVYGKGAWVLHMLRMLLQEERFDALIWRFADGDHPQACRFVTTDEFTALVEEASGWELGWFWQRYLYTAELPWWRMTRTSPGARDRIVLQWNDPSFEMPLPVDIGGKRKLVAMIDGRAEFGAEPGVEVVVDPDREILTADR